MGFVKTDRELAAYYEIPGRHFPGAQMLGAIFQTTPETVARLLPPPLEPADMPNGLVFIAEYPETNLGPGYREAALFLSCQYAGETGNYCLSMPIDSEEARIYNGRDIFGFPKKKASITLERHGDRVRGSVERHGARFFELETTLASSMPSLPPMGANFLFKASPRIDLQPGFDGPVLLCRHQTDIEMKSLEVGGAEVRFHPAPFDPWAEIEVANVLLGFYLVSNNTMRPGSVLTEVDGDAFLPYYFKMTDFFGDAA